MSLDDKHEQWYVDLPFGQRRSLFDRPTVVPSWAESSLRDAGIPVVHARTSEGEVLLFTTATSEFLRSRADRSEPQRWRPTEAQRRLAAQREDGLAAAAWRDDFIARRNERLAARRSAQLRSTAR